MIGPGARGKAIARLLFPGVVATCLTVPSLVPGALAFDIRGNFGLTAAEIGAMVAVFYLLSTIATRAAMSLLGRFSPMAMARAGLLLGTVGMLTAVLLGSKTGLWCMALGTGVANGLATPSANLLIALTVPAGRQGLAFGLRVTAVPAAAAITAAGAFMVASTDAGWRVAVTLMSSVLVLVFFISLPGGSTPVRPPRPVAAGNERRGLSSLRLLALGGLLAASACATLSPFLVEGLIASGVDPGDAALLLGASAWLGVVTRLSAGIVADRFPYPFRHLRSTSVMLWVAAAGMLGLAFGTSTSVLVMATLLTFGIGWAWPGLLHHAAITLHRDHMAKATSQMQMGTFLGGLLGPLGFGLVVQLGSYRMAWSTTAALAALAGATLLLGGHRTNRASGPGSR